MKTWISKTAHTNQPMIYATDSGFVNLFDFLGRKVARVAEIISQNSDGSYKVRVLNLTPIELLRVAELMFPANLETEKG